jgi:hypothetical protein
MMPVMMGLFAAMGNLEMRGLRRFIKANRQEEGTTAVHRAAARGDVEMLKLFKEVANVHPASATLRSARRGTPLDVVNKASLGAKADYYQTILEEQIGLATSPPKVTTPPKAATLKAGGGKYKVAQVVRARGLHSISASFT